MQDRRKDWRAVGAGALVLVSAATLTWGLGGGPTVLDALAALTGHRKPDVIYFPTPVTVVDRMLELAEIKKGDVLYDLGCGDGRIVIAAAKRYGIKAIGFDIDPKRVAEASENVRKSGVSELVTIKQQDIFQIDLSEATVVTMYLLPALNVKLMPQLARLKPGSRIVSHAFDMKGARPKTVETIGQPPFNDKTLVYLWVVPWEKE
jgi:SAM-dependent methyltransferase